MSVSSVFKVYSALQKYILATTHKQEDQEDDTILGYSGV
jgi:hypothetical protein